MTDLPRGLGAPATRALAAAGVERLDDLTTRTEAAVAGLHGVGPRAVALLQRALADQGLSFSTARSGEPSAGVSEHR